MGTGLCVSMSHGCKASAVVLSHPIPRNWLFNVRARVRIVWMMAIYYAKKLRNIIKSVEAPANKQLTHTHSWATTGKQRQTQ